MKRRIILSVLFALALTNVLEAQRPNLLVFNDDMAKRYFSGGFAKDNILTLYAMGGYDKLTDNEKQRTFNCFIEKFPSYQLVVVVSEIKKELWLPIDGGLLHADTWELETMARRKTSDVSGAEKAGAGSSHQRRRATRRFYYLGGQFSGAKGSHNGTINGRFGTFLYDDKWDTSLTLNLGYVKNEKFQFAGSTGLDTRVYFPIKKIRLAPYVGAGVSWTFAPTRYVELKGLAGSCWFIGGGSIDAGVQYGLKSGFSFTVGYTFQPKLKAR